MPPWGQPLYYVFFIVFELLCIPTIEANNLIINMLSLCSRLMLDDRHFLCTFNGTTCHVVKDPFNVKECFEINFRVQDGCSILCTSLCRAVKTLCETILPLTEIGVGRRNTCCISPRPRPNSVVFLNSPQPDCT